LAYSILLWKYDQFPSNCYLPLLSPAGVKPLTATIAPFGMSDAASSAVRLGYVLFVAIVSTSFELRRTPLKKTLDTFPIIGDVINPAPY
jgi:hypothetical protein